MTFLDTYNSSDIIQRGREKGRQIREGIAAGETVGEGWTYTPTYSPPRNDVPYFEGAIPWLSAAYPTMRIPTFAELNPQAYFTSQMPANLSPGIRDWYQGQYGDVYRRFQAEQNKKPGLTFEDFLPGWNYLQEYYGLAPQQRGYNQSRFRSPSAFLY